MQKIADPAQSLDRASENWQKMGRSEKWIQQRMTGQETRNKIEQRLKEVLAPMASDRKRHKL
jgi:DNA-damage-inducible protein D